MAGLQAMGVSGPRIAVVVGMRAEARLARRLGWPVVVGGGSAAGAETAAQLAVSDGAAALVSFGLAGGLDPALRPGTILVPDAVIANRVPIPTDAALSQRLGGAARLQVLGAEAVAATAAAKRAQWEASGA